MNSPSDWQTWATLAVVAVTALMFLRNALRKKKAGGCGSGCGCSASKKSLVPPGGR